MYKMIVLDLDGTLLNDSKQVSKENIDSIRRAHIEKDVIFVIATGRPLEYAIDICNVHGESFTDYIISCNGAHVKNIKTNEVINEVTFTNEEVLKIRDIFIEEKADYMMVYVDGKSIKETINNGDLSNTGATVDDKDGRSRKYRRGN